MDARSYSCSMVNPALPNDPPKSFTFDGVYAEDSTTEQIYNDIGFALVEVILSMILSKTRGTPSMKLDSKIFDVHSSDICQKKRIDMRIPGICGR